MQRAAALRVDGGWRVRGTDVQGFESNASNDGDAGSEAFRGVVAIGASPAA